MYNSVIADFIRMSNNNSKFHPRGLPPGLFHLRMFHLPDRGTLY